VGLNKKCLVKLALTVDQSNGSSSSRKAMNRISFKIRTYPVEIIHKITFPKPKIDSYNFII
jgi:hypothetical protein